MPQEIIPPRSRFFYGYWILLAAFLIQVVLQGCAGYSFSLYVLPIENEFHWSRASIMTGTMLMSLTMGLSSPLIGKVVYRWGAKKVIVAGAITISISFALLSLIQSLWQFYVLFAVAGLGTTAAGIMPASMVISNWFKKRRGFGIGILGMGIGVGGFIVPRILSNYILPGFGWRAGYVFSGILLAVGIIPLAILVIKSTPKEMGLLPDNGDVGEDKQHQGRNTPEPGIKLDRAIMSPAFWLMAISFTTFGFANSHTFQNQVPHLETIGFSAVIAAVTVQGMGIGSAVGKFGFGWLCDYIRPKYILVIGSVLEAAATLILISVKSSSSELLLWSYSILMGLGVGSWLPSLAMTTSATFGLVAYGVIFGVFNMLFGISGAAGPVVGGYIFDKTGSYYSAFVICLIAYAIAVTAMLLVNQPKVKGK